MYSPAVIYNQNLQRIETFFRSLRLRHINIFLAVLGFFIYANAIFHPFVHDDAVFIEHNPYIADLNLKDIFTQTAIANQHFPLVNTYYRPFLELFDRLEFRVYHLNPAGYHLTNVIIHILNAMLLCQLIFFLRIKNKSEPQGWDKAFALIVAVIFLIHPAQSEAVACIFGISNLLSTLFVLTVFYLYLRSFTQDHRRNIRLYSTSLFVFFLALLTKEGGVIVPFLILLYEICFFSQNKNKLNVLGKLGGYLAVIGGYFILRKILFGHPITPWVDSSLEFRLRLLALPSTFLTYLGILFVPYNLHYYRCMDILKPFVWPLIFFMVIIVLAALIIKWTKEDKRRWVLFGLGWFLIALAPVLNIVPLVNEYSLLLTAEHFLYLPIVGMVFMVLSVGEYWLERIKKQEALYLIMMLLGSSFLIFSFVTMKQNIYWRGEIPLFEQTVRYEKNFGRAHMLLAKAYAFKDRHEEAIKQYNIAAGIMTKYVNKVKEPKIKAFYLGFLKDINLDLAHCYEAMGDFAKSPQYYLKALDIDPKDWMILNNLGFNYLKLSDTSTAIEYFEKAIALNDQDLMLKNSLALCYKETGQTEKAAKLFREIVAKDPSSASAKKNLDSLENVIPAKVGIQE